MKIIVLLFVILFFCVHMSLCVGVYLYECASNPESRCVCYCLVYTALHALKYAYRISKEVYIFLDMLHPATCICMPILFIPVRQFVIQQKF